MSAREDLYMRCSGASTRRLAEGVHYYPRLKQRIMISYERNVDHDSKDLDFLNVHSQNTLRSSSTKIKKTSTNANGSSPSTNETDDLLLHLKNRSLEILMRQIDVDVSHKKIANSRSIFVE